MKLLKYLALELKSKKEGPLYAIRNKSKAADLILLLNYLFFEYTRNDLELIVKNLEVLDAEMDDEIILHGSSRSLFLDVTDPAMIYISFLADYLDFEDSLTGDSTSLTFVHELKNKTFDSFKINRTCFLQLLRDWHIIIEQQPICIAMYQDKNNNVGFVSFATKEAAELYEKQNLSRS